jgi:hypothetical protein
MSQARWLGAAAGSAWVLMVAGYEGLQACDYFSDSLPIGPG